MRFSEEFRDQELVREVVRRLHRLEPPPATLMEVCGTHTMAVARFGLKTLLPPQVRLISGPGCPVCVTAPGDIDAFLALGEMPGTMLVSFGDMLRVPGSATSLERQRAAGAEVQVVYAPFDAVDLARQHPEKNVFFFGVGFETTMPATALAIKLAADQGLANFSIFQVHKTLPPALSALLRGGEVRISGFLLPGHVTTVIGAAAYEFLPSEFHTPGAVAGFEPLDVLLGVEALLKQIKEGAARIDNAYTRAAPAQPNPHARVLLDQVFAPADAVWRGLGVIPGSGVTIRPAFALHDAGKRFAEVLARVPPAPASPCRCGEVLRGALAPKECPLFDRTCTPSQPLGPCMVSGEGACAAAYKYERG